MESGQRPDSKGATRKGKAHDAWPDERGLRESSQTKDCCAAVSAPAGGMYNSGMDDAPRIVRKVRSRLQRIRFVEHFQIALPLVLLVTLGVGVIGHFLGYALVPLTAAVAAVLLAALFSLVRILAKPVSRAFAASEADRILGTRERISTTLALSEGRADDPYGFAAILSAEAGKAIRVAPTAKLRTDLKARFRLRTLSAALLVGALFLIPLIPVELIADPEHLPPDPTELRKVAEKLRVLERKILKKETELNREGQKRAREELKRLREEIAKLRGDNPRRSGAVDRLKKLERKAKDGIRRKAGLKARDPEDSEIAENETLNELSKALKALEEADLKATRERLSSLWDKLQKEGVRGLDAGELASMERSVRRLNDAMRALAERAGENSELAEFLKSLGMNESLQKLARALAEMRQLMKERGLKPGDEEALAEAMRNYKPLQLSEEEIERMLEALEELKKLLESGAEISMCRGEMTGLLLPGMGMGMFPLPGGLGGMPLGGAGFGGSEGNGDGTGGPGTGRGGLPGSTPDGRTTNPDLVPGTPGTEGRARLLRTVRSLPSPDDDPKAYQELMREASLEAEEALRRGEIPRAYRGYVRRFFSGPEDE
jgi:hypothetical protein